MPYTVGAVSLGCNKNRVDTETALGLFRDNGFDITSDPAAADILMVNTCGFIESAKEESIDTILEMARYKEEGRCRLLVVTGCLAQRYQESLMKEMPEIDVMLGVNQYSSLISAIREALKGQKVLRCQDDGAYFDHNRVLTTPSWSAYIRIGEGCSNRCTFCAIPLIRGPYRSRDEGAVLKEIADLAAQGVKEHILVAQDTTRFGTDHGGHTQLPALMKKAAVVPGVEWLRVLYCYPDETNEELLDTLAGTPNICPYLDIPLQHINADMLRRMHRRGTRDDILRCVRGAKDRGLTLRTTLIVGFPGETEDQFLELLDFVEETEFDRLGAFPYSAEDDTPAARMPDQIPDEVKQERYDRLMTLQNRISMKKNQARVGEETDVLITDRNQAGVLLARSRREAPETDGEILLTGTSSMKPGDFARARIVKAGPYDLEGQLL